MMGGHIHFSQFWGGGFKQLSSNVGGVLSIFSLIWGGWVFFRIFSHIGGRCVYFLEFSLNLVGGQTFPLKNCLIWGEVQEKIQILGVVGSKRHEKIFLWGYEPLSQSMGGVQTTAVKNRGRQHLAGEGRRIQVPPPHDVYGTFPKWELWTIIINIHQHHDVHSGNSF